MCSVTSFSELARDAREIRALEPAASGEPPRAPATSQRCLAGDAPIVAATDYVRAWPQLIAPAPRRRRFIALGTDGFGRSDTRAALRRFFEVDRHHVVLAALDALRRQGTVDAALCADAIARYGIDSERDPPWIG